MRATIGLGLLLGISACWQPAATVPNAPPTTPRPAPPKADSEMATIDLQRAHGWHVGTDDTDLDLAEKSGTDSEDSVRWTELEPTLSATLAPPPRWQPFYIPTLFEAVEGDQGAELRSIMTPTFTAAMKDAYTRATALESLLAQAGWPSDLAVVIDLPGPESVATAARLASRLAPVFDFDDWPHPDGVVRAQDTLGAALFYATAFDHAKAKRPPGAPPMFVLDSGRLAEYVDPDQFDNRYEAVLPPPEILASTGIHRILYVNHDGEAELDDLNGALMSYAQLGIDARMLSMSDFAESGDAPSEEEQLAPDDPSDLWVELDPGAFLYWGGTPWAHRNFWSRLGWPYGRRAGVYEPPPVKSLEMRAPQTAHVVVEKEVSLAPAWRPAKRQTIFTSTRAHGGPTHRLVGWVAVKTSRAGRVVAIRSKSLVGEHGHEHIEHGGTASAHLVSGMHARELGHAGTHASAHEVSGGNGYSSSGGHGSGGGHSSGGGHGSGGGHSSGGGGHGGGGHR